MLIVHFVIFTYRNAIYLLDISQCMTGSAPFEEMGRRTIRAKSELLVIVVRVLT